MRIFFIIFMLFTNAVFADPITVATTNAGGDGSSSFQAPQTAPNVSLSPSAQDKEGISKFFERSNFRDFAEQPESKPFVISSGIKHEH